MGQPSPFFNTLGGYGNQGSSISEATGGSKRASGTCRLRHGPCAKVGVQYAIVV